MSRIFGAIAQNGYVVRDLKAAMDHWINVMGVGPWFYVERLKPGNFRYKGEASAMEMRVAVANSGDIQIELIQPLNDAPSMYRDFLAAGHEGLQHVAYWTTDYQGLYDQALALGFKVGHEGEIGGPDGRFAYFHVEAHPGTVIELSDVGGRKRAIFEHIRNASKNWDGSDPIRPVSP